MSNQALANKYRPTEFSQVYGQGVTVAIVKKMCEAEELSNRNFLFTGPAGTGKAQPLYSKVLTPDGFIDMGSVKVGQKIITGSGAIAEVSGVYPQGVKRIYEITLQDRTKIRVAEDHLNVFYRYNQDKKCRQDYCMSTLELIDFMQHSYYKLRMDIPMVDFSTNSVLVDPYLMGALIGDGSLSGNFAFSNNEDDVIQKIDSILMENYAMHLSYADKYSYRIVYNDNPKHSGNRGDHGKSPIIRNYDVMSTLKGQLAHYGLLCKSVDKHIPSEYLLNDRDTRISLLQGLFDTDGHIDRIGNVEYTTSSKQLSDDFAFLVRSLGIRDTVVEKTPTYSHNGELRTGHVSYRHNLKIPNGLPFYTSKKHTARYKDRQATPLRVIKSIEYIGEEECQCIYVDHPDHTYISDGFIPTHNTTLSRIIAKSLNGSTDNIIEVDAASNSGVDAVRELIQEASQYPIGTKYKLIICDECHSFSLQAWQALLKCLEEQVGSTIWIFATTNPEKIPETILSRVVPFKLSKISTENIAKRLKYILDSEISEGREIQYDESALSYIAVLANGGMRDAITSLDKCLAFGNNITSELVEKALDLPNYDNYFGLLNALVKKNNAEITQVIDQVYNSGTNFVKWFEGFHGFLCNIVKYVFLKDITRTTIPPHYQTKLEKYNEQHAFICLKLANVIMNMNRELKTTQYLQETAMTYLCAPVAPKKA